MHLYFFQLSIYLSPCHKPLLKLFSTHICQEKANIFILLFLNRFSVCRLSPLPSTCLPLVIKKLPASSSRLYTCIVYTAHTGCSLNIVFFFEDFEIYSGLWPLSVCAGIMLGLINGR